MPLREKLDALTAEAGYARLDLDSQAKRLTRLERRVGKSLLDSFVDGFFSPVDAIPIGFGASSELTIATGLVTKTFIYHTIDTQADAASDNLAGVQNGKDGDPLIIRPNNDARSIVVKHNDVAEGTAGSRIFLNGDADLTLDDADDTLTLIYDKNLDSGSGAWIEVARGQPSHTLLSAIHTDTVVQTVSVGSLIYGNATPAWDELVISVPAANVRNVIGVDNGDTVPAWKTALDAINPEAIATAAGPGTSLVFSHRDHVHLGTHNVFSAIHGDTTGAASPVDGDVIIANVTPAWSKLAISIPGVNVLNVLGVATAELRPSWKAALDAVAPTTIGVSDAAAAGTSLIFSHRDHQHGSPATFPAPAHNIFSTTHGDTTGAASPVDGDIIIGNVTPAWSKLAISIPAANVRNVLGIDNAELRPSWKVALDATAAADVASAGAAGTSLVFSHRDHAHRGVLSVNKLAGAALYGGVTLSEGANITITQVGQDIAIAAAAAGGHNIFSVTHTDTTGAASPVDGDIVIGNVTPAWSKLAISVPAANVRNVLGIDNAELRPSWKTALDATNPANIAAAASPGTSLVFSHRDHVHAHPDLGDLHTGYLLATGARAGASAGAQSFGTLGIATDLIAESTATAGVTVDGLLIKDEYVEFDEIAAPGAGAANKLRLYVKDVGAATTLEAVNSAGNLYPITHPPTVRVTRTGVHTMTPADGAFAILWNVETFDSDAIHSTVSNTSRLTAPIDGIYRIYASVDWGTPTGNGRLLTRIRKDGATTIATEEDSSITDGTGVASQNAYTEYALLATNYVEVVIQVTALTTINANAGGWSFFGMTWVRPIV